MKKALVIGINYYKDCDQLYGCVNDSYAVKDVLERNSDGTVNFSVIHKAATNSVDMITRVELRKLVKELFDGDAEIALLYFAGHGSFDSTGGFLISSDASANDDGLSLHDVIALANNSKAKNKIVVLDSCHSGIAGSSSQSAGHVSEIAEGVTILTASTAEQYASEENGSGVFTSLFVDALCGSASNLVGDVTPGSIYAHIDQSLGPWEQRPVFKTNVKRFVSLRKTQAPISINDLQQISTLFPYAGFEFKLDPTFEPEIKGRDIGMPVPDPENTHIFSILQKFNRLNLLVPVGVTHMWNAAMQGKSCKLTALGEHYRRLAAKGQI